MHQHNERPKYDAEIGLLIGILIAVAVGFGASYAGNIPDRYYRQGYADGARDALSGAAMVPCK